MRRRLVAVSMFAVLLAALAPTAAEAQSATSVTLTPSASDVTYGDAVTLSGATDPATPAEAVEIRDETETVLATATTDANGAYSLELEPQRSIDVHAVWRMVASAPVHIGVRAVVSARLTDVRLFDTATVHGWVSPAHPGEKVEVVLTLAGDVLATRRPVIAADGMYGATFPIRRTGTYRVRVRFSDADLLRGAASAGPVSPPLPSLREGSDGVFAKLLEHRLVALHYRLVGVNERYDERTADAVLAFRKVQGMQRVFTVDAAMWRALADPRVPRPRLDVKRFHFEVDQAHQVLYAVEGGEITDILHISTGKPSTPTRDGSFRVYGKIAGLTGGGLYYPSYFDGLRALHGYVEVPTYAASHGCVRIPYWNAKWVYRHAPIGTQVIVYH